MGMAAAEQQYHILAVDDSFLDRKLIERILKTSSYQVTTVDSGYKALEFLGFQDDEEGNTNRPSVSPKSQMEQVSVSPRKKCVEVEVNLIITDYCMPGMTGYDLLKKLKESSSLRIRSIPVVIMSSEDVSSRITSCLDGGAEEFFIKPVRLSDVNKLRPYMLKPIHGVQKEQQNTEQDVNDTDLLKAEKQQESELITEPHQQQQEQQPQKQESELLTEPQQQQQQQSNKRKSIDEGLSPDRTRHRCSGLTVV